jgi:hypothetical protein
MIAQAAPSDGLGQRITQGVFAGRQCYSLSCHAKDVAPLTPTSNPRAQLRTDYVIPEGFKGHIKVGLYVPSGSLPASIDWSSKWVEFVQFAYGPPFAGSPPLRIMTQDGTTFGLREADGPFQWKVPLTRDVWWDFDLYLVQKRTGGWYWLGDATGKTLVPARSYATVQACNGDGPNATYLDAYMCAGTCDRIGPIYLTEPTITPDP